MGLDAAPARVDHAAGAARGFGGGKPHGHTQGGTLDHHQPIHYTIDALDTHRSSSLCAGL